MKVTLESLALPEWCTCMSYPTVRAPDAEACLVARGLAERLGFIGGTRAWYMSADVDRSSKEPVSNL